MLNSQFVQATLPVEMIKIIESYLNKIKMSAMINIIGKVDDDRLIKRVRTSIFIYLFTLYLNLLIIVLIFSK